MRNITVGPKYSFCDLEIVPAQITNITSRSQCNPYYTDNNGQNKNLPIFTAPMDSVADDTNYKNFIEAGIIPIIHRNVSLEKRISLTKQSIWCAYSMDEYEELFCDESKFPKAICGDTFALIDCANGHMMRVLELSAKSKLLVKKINEKRYAENKLPINFYNMAGNIANPRTYEMYCKAGIDFVRCSIGTGSMCLTSANTAIGYPNASLIMEMRHLDTDYLKRQRHVVFGNTEILNINDIFVHTKIVADGGIRNYSDAVIALACGADYVMIGGIFAGCIDSCARFVKNDDGDGFVEYHTNSGRHIELSTTTAYNINELNDLLKKNNVDKSQCELLSGFYGINRITMSLDILKYSDIRNFILRHFTLYKESHGMSTKEAQREGLAVRGHAIDESKLKTSEGKRIITKVEYSIESWTENFVDYLRSAMSYTNCNYLFQFIGDVDLVVKSYGTMHSVNR